MKRNLIRKFTGIPKTAGKTEVNTPAFHFRIIGDEVNLAQIDLSPGETIRAEVGSLMYMTEGVTMETSLQGGLKSGFKRFLAGSSVYLTDFSYKGDSGFGSIMLSSNSFSKIFSINIEDYPKGLICHREAYICSSLEVEIGIERLRGFKTGIFGGHGFNMQKLTGRGTALLKGGGEIRKFVLKPNENLYLSGGNIVAFDKNVTYTVSKVQGITNKLFSGEGLFLANLKGPGEVYTQTMGFNQFEYSVTNKLGASLGLIQGGKAVFDLYTPDKLGDPIDSKTPAEIESEKGDPIEDIEDPVDEFNDSIGDTLNDD